MGRIIVANRRGHQVIEWDTETDTEEARARIAEAERILEEARANGCLISKKVGNEHVMRGEIALLVTRRPCPPHTARGTPSGLRRTTPISLRPSCRVRPKLSFSP